MAKVATESHKLLVFGINPESIKLDIFLVEFRMKNQKFNIWVIAKQGENEASNIKMYGSQTRNNNNLVLLLQ